MIRSYHHREFPLDELLRRKSAPITALLPAREVADTVGAIVTTLESLGGLLDQVLVVDAGSADGTQAVAERAGAKVVQEAELRPDLGPVLGKGDAVWRALTAVRGDLVVCLDADTADFPAHFATGLLGPLIADPQLAFAKAYFDRPFTAGGEATIGLGGGRVTELTARPLLSAFYPELAEFRQPLAGEFAARRDLLERIPFSTGYALEAAMLFDVKAAVGLDAMTQVDLERRHNRHQPLSALAPMAYAVMGVICERLRSEGRLTDAALAPLRSANGELIALETVQRDPLRRD